MTRHISKLRHSGHAHSYDLSFIVMMEAPTSGEQRFFCTGCQ
jgi:hypothetical protein